MMHRSNWHYGFTLVEMSIVLVIIGLLVGGVLSGQSLIRAAELRAATTEWQKYNTAVKAFRDKYQAIPGDMNNATAFWGNMGGTGCTNNSGTAVTSPGTCDGNGDGILNAPAAVSQTGEAYQFWRQLVFAGLIEGSYTGVAGPNQVYDSTPGTNVPKSKISNGSWFAWYWGSVSANGTIFDGIYNNFLELGAPFPGGDPANSLLKPEELWNIDTKLDDGLPDQGQIVARNWSICSTATASNQTTSTYLLSSSSVSCIAIFKQQF